MADETPYRKIQDEYLSNELRVLNAHIPRQRKPLTDLLKEEYPHVICADDSGHFFKKKELSYLVSITDEETQKALLLPMLIELGPGEGEVSLICGDIEEKLIAKILGMTVEGVDGKIRLYKPQLNMLRKVLKTTTQYLFSTRISTH